MSVSQYNIKIHIYIYRYQIILFLHLDSFLSNLPLSDSSVYLRLRVKFASQFDNTKYFSLHYDVFFPIYSNVLVKILKQMISKHLYIMWRKHPD